MSNFEGRVSVVIQSAFDERYYAIDIPAFLRKQAD